jgi:hypothetical protein
MIDLFSKCGTNCGRCPSFRDNLKSDDDRRRCSDGWLKYHGFRYSPEKLLRCDGCQAPDDENPVRYISCLIRRCAVKNGVQTCARCSGYPCEELVSRALGQDWRESIIARLGAPIPEEEDRTFVEPYEGLKHMDDIRAALNPEEIVEMTTVAVKNTTVEFPDDLPLPRKETSALEALHRILADVNSPGDNVSYARQEVLKQRRLRLLKVLWAFGLLGELEEEEGPRPRLVMDSKVYYTQKIHSDYATIKRVLEALEEHGVRCEIVPLVEEGWLTPTGALRKKVGREGAPAWLLKMACEEKAGGARALGALRNYAAKLDERYGKSAFRYFAKADMRILREKTRCKNDKR